MKLLFISIVILLATYLIVTKAYQKRLEDEINELKNHISKAYHHLLDWNDTQGDTYKLLYKTCDKLLESDKNVLKLHNMNIRTIKDYRQAITFLNKAKKNMIIVEENFEKLNLMKKQIHKYIHQVNKQDIMNIEQRKTVGLLKAYLHFDIIKGYELLNQNIVADTKTNRIYQEQMI